MADDDPRPDGRGDAPPPSARQSTAAFMILRSARSSLDSVYHTFARTACGLGKILGKLTLTPVVGAVLFSFAAIDVLATGVTGTKIRAREVLYKAKKDDIGFEDDPGRQDSAGSTGTAKFMGSATRPPERAAVMPVEVFDPDACDYKRLRREYLEKGVPFILRKPSGVPISHASPPRMAEDGTEGISVVDDNANVKLDGIDQIVKKLLPMTFRIHWPLWFQGNYKSGLAHVDLGPGTCNFYFLKRGKKDVIIAPFEVTRRLTLATGIDSIHLPGSAGNHDYLNDLDAYYRVLLEEQSVLIFNNSGCLHHFTNVVEEGVTPIACSNRCKHAYGSDPRGWLNLAGNLKYWYNITDHAVGLLTSGEQIRKQEKD